MAKKSSLPALEKSLTEIARLAEQMEQGEDNLERSLEQFERGITLIRHAQKILNEAECKVKILLEQNGKETLTEEGNPE